MKNEPYTKEQYENMKQHVSSGIDDIELHCGRIINRLRNDTSRLGYTDLYEELQKRIHEAMHIMTEIEDLL